MEQLKKRKICRIRGVILTALLVFATAYGLKNSLGYALIKISLYDSHKLSIVKTIFGSNSFLLSAVPEAARLVALETSICRHDIKFAMRILDSISEIREQNSKFSHLLMMATYCQEDEMRNELLHRGVSANLPIGTHSKTPLMVAAIMNDVAMIKLLLSRGADPEAIDDWCQTALGHAIEKGSVVAAKELLYLDLAQGAPQRNSLTEAYRTFVINEYRELSELQAQVKHESATICPIEKTNRFLMDCFVGSIKRNPIRSGYFLTFFNSILHGFAMDEALLDNGHEWDYYFLSYAVAAIETFSSKQIFYLNKIPRKVIKSNAAELKRLMEHESNILLRERLSVETHAKMRIIWGNDFNSFLTDKKNAPATLRHNPVTESDWKELKKKAFRVLKGS